MVDYAETVLGVQNRKNSVYHIQYMPSEKSDKKYPAEHPEVGFFY